MRLCESHATWIENENRKLTQSAAAKRKGEQPDIFELELPALLRAPLATRERHESWMILTWLRRFVFHNLHRSH